VQSGPCTQDGPCISSPNFPSHYSDDQSCVISVPVGMGPIYVKAFDTESDYDVLTVNGESFHAQHSPEGIRPTTDIVWSSDSNITDIGWKICAEGVDPSLPTPSPAPTPPRVPPCTDSPQHWIDSDGLDCQAYDDDGWCTEQGDYGAGWSAAWGTFQDYAIDGISAVTACCSCGGGARTWTVQSGPCPQDGTCISSPNFPSSYSDDQSCVISVPAGMGPISVEAFGTESDHDILTVNGESYHGQHSPEGVTPTTDIIWASDSHVTSTGWKICANWFAPSPTPSPTPVPSSHDEACVDSPQSWLDAVGYSCETYVAWELCTADGDYGERWADWAGGTFMDYAVNDISAVNACCGCGGGTTPSADPPTEVACSDSPQSWVDSKNNSCQRYVDSAACTTQGDYGEGWDTSWGTFEDLAVDGVSAATACCGCGGGAPSETPLPNPTPAPVPQPTSPTPPAPSETPLPSPTPAPSPTLSPTPAPADEVAVIQGTVVLEVEDPSLACADAALDEAVLEGLAAAAQRPRDAVEVSCSVEPADARRLTGSAGPAAGGARRLTGSVTFAYRIRMETAEAAEGAAQRIIAPKKLAKLIESHLPEGSAKVSSASAEVTLTAPTPAPPSSSGPTPAEPGGEESPGATPAPGEPGHEPTSSPPDGDDTEIDDSAAPPLRHRLGLGFRLLASTAGLALGLERI